MGQVGKGSATLKIPCSSELATRRKLRNFAVELQPVKHQVASVHRNHGPGSIRSIARYIRGQTVPFCFSFGSLPRWQPGGNYEDVEKVHECGVRFFSCSSAITYDTRVMPSPSTLRSADAGTGGCLDQTPHALSRVRYRLWSRLQIGFIPCPLMGHEQANRFERMEKRSTVYASTRSAGTWNSQIELIRHSKHQALSLITTSLNTLSDNVVLRENCRL